MYSCRRSNVFNYIYCTFSAMAYMDEVPVTNFQQNSDLQEGKWASYSVWDLQCMRTFHSCIFKGKSTCGPSAFRIAHQKVWLFSGYLQISPKSWQSILISSDIFWLFTGVVAVHFVKCSTTRRGFCPRLKSMKEWGTVAKLVHIFLKKLL